MVEKRCDFIRSIDSHKTFGVVLKVRYIELQADRSTVRIDYRNTKATATRHSCSVNSKQASKATRAPIELKLDTVVVEY